MKHRIAEAVQTRVGAGRSERCGHREPRDDPAAADILIVPIARFWIRFAPVPLMKEWLWSRTRWRTYDYRARTRHGTWMQGRSTDLVQGYIYYFGHWEPNLTAWLLKRFTGMKDRVFLDVGANVGYYAVLAAKKLGDRGTVVAVEASPRIHRMLEDNVRLNALENVRTVCCAALAEPGSVTLYHGGSGNLGGTTTKPGIASDTHGTVIEGRRLCDIVDADELSRVRIVKIDVEGAEWSVLQGLIPSFARLSADVEFVIEVMPGLMKGEDADRLYEFMEGQGFRTYRIENSYDAKSYLSRDGVRHPRRLHRRPTDGGDIVFSRVEAETL